MPRRRGLNGNPIHAVYQVAGSSRAQVCGAPARLGNDSYGKWLDMTSDPSTFLTLSECR